jgi:hypothetical protein
MVLQEGLVGRLQIRKSGRCQLILGSQIMDVEVGTKVGFLQVSTMLYLLKGMSHKIDLELIDLNV